MGGTSDAADARAVFALKGLDVERIQPTTSAAFPRPAVRPAYSVLGHDAWDRAGLRPMADWRRALTEALAQPDLISAWKTDT